LLQRHQKNVGKTSVFYRIDHKKNTKKLWLMTLVTLTVCFLGKRIRL